MNYIRIMYGILVGTLCGYLGIQLEKKIDKRLRKGPEVETLDTRGGDGGDRIGFLSKLLMRHKENLPWVSAILGLVVTTAILQFDEALLKFLSDTTFSSFYIKANSENLYIKVLERRQAINKVIGVRQLLEAFELTPKITYKEKLDGYKLIIMNLLSCDTKKKLIYNIFLLATVLTYLFTGNLYFFTTMIGALIKLIQEGKVSPAVAKTLVILLVKKGIVIPKELEELLSDENDDV
jgi:hypothetical protein